MQFTKLALAGALVASLAGCLQNDTQRGLAGAAAGVVVADALDTNIVTGAAIGGLGGVLCDDLNVTLCNN
jgi:osmotically inducible lipoprotein OsmB